MKQKTKYQKLDKLKGLLTQYGISHLELSKRLGRCYATVNLSLNGKSIFDLQDCKEILKIINLSAKKRGSDVVYTLDDLFFD